MFPLFITYCSYVSMEVVCFDILPRVYFIPERKRFSVVLVSFMQCLKIKIDDLPEALRSFNSNFDDEDFRFVHHVSDCPLAFFKILCN